MSHYEELKEDLKKLQAKIARSKIDRDSMAIIMHPDNLELFEENARRSPQYVKAKAEASKCFGIPVRPDKMLPKHSYTPPKDRFVELTVADAEWALPLGIGRLEPVMYLVDTRFYLFPQEFLQLLRSSQP